MHNQFYGKLSIKLDARIICLLVITRQHKELLSYTHFLEPANEITLTLNIGYQMCSIKLPQEKQITSMIFSHKIGILIYKVYFSGCLLLNNKVYIVGYNDLSSRIVWTIKQYDFNGKLNWINSDYNLEGYFWVLDSSLYLLGNRKVLEDGTIENKFNGSLIYQNSLNGFTTFYSSLYSDPSGLKYTTGHIANLSSDYQVEKETKIKVDNGLYNTFGPVDKDSWVYLSVFLDANDGEKRKLRLEKINKNLD